MYVEESLFIAPMFVVLNILLGHLICITQVLAKLTTHYVKVHSRHCVDEAEVAEHIVGLTSSLASCQFRYQKSTILISLTEDFISIDVGWNF